MLISLSELLKKINIFQKQQDIRGRQSNWDAELDDNQKTFNFYLVIFLTLSVGILLVIASLCKLMGR